MAARKIKATFGVELVVICYTAAFIAIFILLTST